MNNEYQIEEGHCFSEEDTVSYIIWKVQDLKSQGYSDEEILYFDDQAIWHEYVGSIFKCVKIT